MSLAYLKENEWTVWLLTTVAYFVAGAFPCVGAGYVSDRIEQRRADAIARERK
jgi:4-hydroxybenzoate polyprenyltransferase